jgi:hypothetical protein
MDYCLLHVNQASACIPGPWQSDQLGNGFFPESAQIPRKVIAVLKIATKKQKKILKSSKVKLFQAESCGLG